MFIMYVTKYTFFTQIQYVTFIYTTIKSKKSTHIYIRLEFITNNSYRIQIYIYHLLYT